MSPAHRDSHGRLVKNAGEFGGAKSDWRVVSRKTEGRRDSSAHLDGDGGRRDSGIDVGDPSRCAFHSCQSGDGSTMVQSHSHDTLPERAGHLPLEVSRSTGQESSKKIVRLNKQSYRIDGEKK